MVFDILLIETFYKKGCLKQIIHLNKINKDKINLSYIFIVLTLLSSYNCGGYAFKKRER